MRSAIKCWPIAVQQLRLRAEQVLAQPRLEPPQRAILRERQPLICAAGFAERGPPEAQSGVVRDVDERRGRPVGGQAFAVSDFGVQQRLQHRSPPVPSVATCATTGIGAVRVEFGRQVHEADEEGVEEGEKVELYRLTLLCLLRLRDMK